MTLIPSMPAQESSTEPLTMDPLARQRELSAASVALIQDRNGTKPLEPSERQRLLTLVIEHTYALNKSTAGPKAAKASKAAKATPKIKVPKGELSLDDI